MNNAYDKCPKCEAYAVHLCFNEQPYFVGGDDDKNGEASEYANEDILADEPVSICAEICFNCHYLVSIWIEEPREKELRDE